jgi:hypothetical protein
MTVSAVVRPDFHALLFVWFSLTRLTIQILTQKLFRDLTDTSFLTNCLDLDLFNEAVFKGKGDFLFHDNTAVQLHY